MERLIMKILGIIRCIYCSIIVTLFLYNNLFAEVKNDVRFLAKDDKILRINLEASNSENLETGASINVFSDSMKIASFNLGFVKNFCAIYITEIAELESQIVFIPYLIGRGTGYGHYEWSMIACCDDKILCNDLGLLRYHSVSKYSYIFEIEPSFIKTDVKKNTYFNFKMNIMESDASEFIEGIVRLNVIKSCDGVTIQLIPVDKDSALACLRLYQNKIESISKWAEDRLRAISPNALEAYQKSANKEEYLKILTTSIISYYDSLN